MGKATNAVGVSTVIRILSATQNAEQVVNENKQPPELESRGLVGGRGEVAYKFWRLSFPLSFP